MRSLNAWCGVLILTACVQGPKQSVALSNTVDRNIAEIERS